MAAERADGGVGSGAQAVASELYDLACALTARMLPPPLETFAAALPPRPAARGLAARPLPVLRWCAGLAAGAAANTRELTSALARNADSLSWGQTYRAEDISAAFLERYGWCELLGSRGHFVCAELALGLLLLGPETDYPLHRHEAEEVYIALSGTAFWRKGAEGRERALAPGSVIHHPSWTPHAMRTATEPLLALYLWRGGDLAQKSRLS